MFRRIIIFIILLSCIFTFLINTTSEEFTRPGLQAAVDSYLQAIKKGDISGLPLTPKAKYIENMEDSVLGEGIWKTPLKIDFNRSIFDVEAGETFTEIIITDKNHPYVIGTRLKIQKGKITEVESIVTDKGDWLFNADNYLKFSSAEKWDIIPPEKRTDRKALIAAADAYLNMFDDPSGRTKVPWGYPCARLEGGVYTGRGIPQDTCEVGIPEQGNIKMVKRHYVVDEAMGSVVALVRFGGDNGLPDSHLFRLENGKLRYVHTLTICSVPNCGFPEFPQSN